MTNKKEKDYFDGILVGFLITTIIFTAVIVIIVRGFTP